MNGEFDLSRRRVSLEPTGPTLGCLNGQSWASEPHDKSLDALISSGQGGRFKIDEWSDGGLYLGDPVWHYLNAPVRIWLREVATCVFMIPRAMRPAYLPNGLDTNGDRSYGSDSVGSSILEFTTGVDSITNIGTGGLSNRDSEGRAKR
ncbi:hypothetical protein WN943_008479 [Citrus x changshan-huyou]